jgi:MFS transporter, SP family, ERD6-like sugar transporter
VSYAILAGTVAALLSGTIAEKIGRRLTILLSDLFLIIGPIILSIALGPIMLCFGRLLIGCGLGISMMVVPVFLSESSPASLRSQIVPSYFFMYFLGLIFSYFSGIIFSGKLF